MHQLSINSYYAIRDYGEEEGLRLIKEAGFDYVDYSLYSNPKVVKDILGDDYIDRAHETKRILDKLGLKCNQTHSPFRELTYDSELSTNNIDFVRLLRSIEYAGIIGARNIIVHGFSNPDGVYSKACFEYNRAYYLMLEDLARKSGVKISIENMIHTSFITPKLLSEIVESLNPEVFEICVDLGHTFCAKFNPEDFINQLVKGKLKAVHIQDNFGETDDHLLPFLGKINWDNVMKALADYGYDGDFTLELDGFLGHLQNREIAENAYRMAYKTVECLRNKFFEYKK